MRVIKPAYPDFSSTAFNIRMRQKRLWTFADKGSMNVTREFWRSSEKVLDSNGLPADVLSRHFQVGKVLDVGVGDGHKNLSNNLGIT